MANTYYHCSGRDMADLSPAFVHKLADVQATSIGPGTRVWQFVVILRGAKIGRDANICAHVFIENDVIVGDRVTIKSGVQLWDGIRIEDDVFIGPNVTFTNDPFPRSKSFPEAFSPTIIERGASIGANATILPGVTIGAGAMIGAGAIVTKSVPAHAVVAGQGAAVRRYDVTHSISLGKSAAATSEAIIDLGAGGATLSRLPFIEQPLGNLGFADFQEHVPFPVLRTFWVTGVPHGSVRGEHAHKACHQFLLCVAGSVTALVDDGHKRTTVRLDTPANGLYVPPGNWGTQFDYSADAVLLVFASHPYDPDDYITSYEEFRSQRRE